MKEVSLWVSLDDLIFEHRNKSYGAYLLRKEYPRHLTLATLLVISLLALLIPVSDLVRERTAQALNEVMDPTDHGPNVITDVIIIPPLPKPPVPFVEPPAGTAEPGTRIIPVIDTRPETGTPQPVTGSISGGGETGSVSGAGTGITDTSGSGSGTGTATSAVADPDPYVHNYAEQLPQYPGGDAALYKFLSSHIKYPSGAAAAGIQGRVFVSFICDKNGNVSNVKIEKGIGAGLDEEAVRVVKLLKGFSPALQAGRPVNYRYILPVRFTLN